jgi:F-type H+-transporting ATPase subunit delta
MSLTTLANRYARALVDVTIDRDETNEVRKELDQFAALLKDHADLYEAFASPVVAQQRKRNVLQDILAVTIPRVTTANFLKLLLENHRLHKLDAMLAAMGRELDRRAGVVSADVTFARDPDMDEREQLRKRLQEATGKEVRMKVRTDPNIIGGVVVRLGSQIYDGSIRSQLAELKHQLAEAK